MSNHVSHANPVKADVATAVDAAVAMTVARARTRQSMAKHNKPRWALLKALPLKVKQSLPRRSKTVKTASPVKNVHATATDVTVVRARSVVSALKVVNSSSLRNNPG